MHKITRVIAVLFAAALILLPTMTSAQEMTTPSVIISEIAWAGSSLSNSDEWLELTNLTDIPVDVSDWLIVGAATSGGNLVLPSESVIQPYSTYLISNYAATHQSSALAAEPNHTTTAVSLSNSGLRLILQDSDGAQIDAAGDGGDAFAGCAGGNGTCLDGRFAAMVRRYPVLDGGTAEAWQTASVSSGFKVGTLNNGTPGAVESWFIAATETVTEEINAEEPTEVLPTEVVEEIVSDPVEETVTIEEESEETEGTEGSDGAEGLIEESEGSNGSEESSEETIGDTTTETDTSDETTTTDETTTVTNTETETTETVTTTETDVTEQTAEINSETETVLTQQTSTIINYPPGTLIINEIYSNPPSGEEEWVEVINPYNNVIPLAGWTIREGSGKKTALPDQLLGFGQMVVVINPSGKLNNTGDTVELLDPNEVVIDKIVYGTDAVPLAKTSNSLMRDAEGELIITSTPTKKEMNVFTNNQNTTNTNSTNSGTEITNTNSSDATNTTTAIINQIGEVPYAEFPEGYSPLPPALRFSEIYPDTLHDDLTEEFIELENTSDVAVDLKGWSLEDASGKKYTKLTSLLVAAHGFVVMPRPETKISLNNSDETIRLWTPSSVMADQHSYEKTTKGSALVYTAGGWQWTFELTPDEPNRVSSPAPSASADVVASAAKRSAVSLIRGVTIAQALSLPDETAVRINGVVSAEPGTLGRQFFYAQDQQNGMQIYKYDADFPDLSVGDQVEVVGTLSTYRGERRLKIKNPDDLKVLAKTDLPTPIALTIQETTPTGRLVSFRGVVLNRSGNAADLENNGTTAKVKIASVSEIDPGVFTSGSEAEVTGVLTVADGQSSIMPRNDEDIKIFAVPAALAASTQETGRQQKTGYQTSMAELLLIATALLLSFFAVRRLIPLIKKHYAKNPALGLATQKTS
ncbi:MAG: lamin tail domain-containing protein [Parcubacteria group bacterium]